GKAFWDDGKWAEAVTQYEGVLALKPDYGEAKFALCMSQLPVLYKDEAEIAARRAAYRQCLEALCEDVDRGMTRCDWVKAVGSSQPFFLAYQGDNDRDLQRLYGSLMCRIMAERYPAAALSPPPRADEPVRLGIVSGFFWQHSNWKIPIKGWLSQLDRRRFPGFRYYTPAKQVAAARQGGAFCCHFLESPLVL